MSDLTCTKCNGSFPRRETGSGRQRTVCPDCSAPKQYDHVCIICEKDFRSSKKKQLTCSDDCYIVYDKAKTYKWRHENPERYRELCRKHNKTKYQKQHTPVELACEICGTGFIKKSRSHKTCSEECSEELRRRRQRKTA